MPASAVTTDPPPSLSPTTPPRFSLAAWLTAAVLVTALCGILATVGLLESYTRRYAERRADESLRQIAWNMRDALDRGMQQHFEQIDALASLGMIRQSTSPVEVRDTLEALQVGFPRFAWIGLVGNDGRVVAASDGLLVGDDMRAWPWFDGAQDGPFIGDVHASGPLAAVLRPQPEPWRFVDIAVPVIDAAGTLRGVLAAQLNWSWARDVQAGLLAPALRDRGAEILVLSRTGSVLLGPASLEGRTRLDLPGRVDPAASGPLRGFRVDTIDGEPYFIAVAQTRGAGRFASLGWTVVVRQPTDRALADFRTLRNEMLVTGLFVAAAFGAIATVVARRLASPLHRMAQWVSADHGADHAADPGRIDVARAGIYREAHQLAVALNAMTARQRAHACELEHMNASLEARIAERTEVLEASHRSVIAAQTMLREMTDNLPALIAYIDRDEHAQFLNGAYATWFGVAPETNVGKPMRDVVGPTRYEPRRPHILQALAGSRTSCTSFIETLHGAIDAETVYVPHVGDDGLIKGVFTLTTDVSALKEVERRLAALARFDTLTGLPNRYQLNERLPDALARCRRAASGVAVMFIDIDHFKRVNDSFGHAAGDAVLIEFAERLRRGVRDTDMVARLSGDEFVVVLEGIGNAAEPQSIARKLIASFDRPMSIDGRQVGVGGSIGIAIDADCASTPAELLARADEALYQAKQAGRSTFRQLPVRGSV